MRMTGRKRIGLFLVVAGLVVLAGSGILFRKGAPELAKIAADRATMEDSLKNVRKRLVDVSLKSRGLNESEKTIPDSVRVYGAGQMMALQNSYNKQIRKLEGMERDVKIEIASLDRDAAQAHAAAKQKTLPLAAGGGALLIVGFILTGLASRRVGA
jgi:hypothetical protein